MSTVKSLAQTALDYIGVGSFTEALPAQLRVLARTISAAAQEIQSMRAGLFVQPMGGLLAAPRGASVTVTANSTTIVLHEASGPYAGRTIRIPGDTLDNQIAPNSTETVATGDTTCQLVRPFSGTGATVDAMLYGDAVALPAGITHLVGNVMLVGYGELCPLADHRDFTETRDNLSSDDYGLRSSINSSYNLPDRPRGYWAQTAVRLAGTAAPAGTALVLRIAPIPDRAYALDFEVAYAPTPISADSLADAAEDITIPIPGGMAEFVLEAFVLQRWTGSPWFTNKAASTEIARQFTAAQDYLLNYQAQSVGGARIIIVCR